MRRIDRFDKYMEYRGLSDNKVASHLGLSNGVIGKSRQPGRDLSDRVVEKIENFYKDLNIDWLITGDGDMIKITGNNNVVGENHVNDNAALLKALEELAEHRKQIDKLLNIIEDQRKEIQSLRKNNE